MIVIAIIIMTDGLVLGTPRPPPPVRPNQQPRADSCLK